MFKLWKCWNEGFLTDYVITKCGIQIATKCCCCSKPKTESICHVLSESESKFVWDAWEIFAKNVGMHMEKKLGLETKKL